MTAAVWPCALCGAVSEQRWCGRRCINAPARQAARAPVVDKPVVANKAAAMVANKPGRKGDRHKDADARRAYMRKLMAARRALARAAS